MRESPKLSPQPLNGIGADQRESSSRAEEGVPRLFGGGACLRELDAATRIVAGNAGDHPLVARLLVEVYQAPLAEDFQSRLDEPSYEPSDRLLLVRDGQLAGQVQVAKHFAWFQEQRCPLVKLQDFVTLPEYQTGPYVGPLLKMAEATAAREGSILGLVRTDRPEWFEQHGWSCCRGQGHTRANVRSILPHFDAQWANPRRRKEAIEIRTWRHFELDSLRSVYQQLATNMWGALQRSEEQWQWLVNRKAQDQVLIAVERPRDETPDLPEPVPSDQPHVVGYAVVRDSCIVEMFTLPGYSAARPMLVARACRDAIDRDHHFVSLHTPAADPMHEVLVTAGGTWVADSPSPGGVWMLKLLAPDRWVERFYPVLHQRAREAGLRSAQQIDFFVGDDSYRLVLTRRSSRLESLGREQATQVECDWQTFQNLLTSNLAIPEAIAQGQLRTDHPSVAEAIAALFPPKLFWQSPFELLRL